MKSCDDISFGFLCAKNPFFVYKILLQQQPIVYFQATWIQGKTECEKNVPKTTTKENWCTLCVVHLQYYQESVLKKKSTAFFTIILNQNMTILIENEIQDVPIVFCNCCFRTFLMYLLYLVYRWLENKQFTTTVLYCLVNI